MYLRGEGVHKMFKKRWGGHKKARPRKEQAQRRKAKDGTRQRDPQQWQVQQNIAETTRQCMFCAINRQNFAADARRQNGTGRDAVICLPHWGHNRAKQKKGGGRKVEAAALSPSQLPCDLPAAVGTQPVVAAAEMAGGEEAAAGGAEGRRMCAVEVEAGVRLGGLVEAELGDELLGGAAPGDKDKALAGALAEADKFADDGGGELFPAVFGVGVGAVGLDGETGVEEEDALAGPGREVAVGWRAESWVVVLEGLEDVHQGGRDAGAGVLDGEGEAVGLVVVVVGVLADDEDADGAERGETGPRVDVVLGREDRGGAGPLLEKEAFQGEEVGLGELLVEELEPGVLHGGEFEVEQLALIGGERVDEALLVEKGVDGDGRRRLSGGCVFLGCRGCRGCRGGLRFCRCRRCDRRRLPVFRLLRHLEKVRDLSFRRRHRFRCRCRCCLRHVCSLSGVCAATPPFLLSLGPPSGAGQDTK